MGATFWNHTVICGWNHRGTLWWNALQALGKRPVVIVSLDIRTVVQEVDSAPAFSPFMAILPATKP